MSKLKFGARIGILGGGQLGRMLAGAAAKLGFDVSIYCPEADAPASRVAGESVRAGYDQLDRVLAWAQTCDAITYEFENVPVSTVGHLIRNGQIVRPGLKALEMSQDRIREKTFLRSCAIPTAEFFAIQCGDDIGPALTQLGGAGLLKTCSDGYDGKGQSRIAAGDDDEAIFRALGSRPCVLEGLVPFRCEVSVIAARGLQGDIVCYDIPENIHKDGILKRSTVPAALTHNIMQDAFRAASRLVETLDYVGVLALEFFVLPDGRLIANEFAPRVHNSGHWTVEACLTGQFEQHIRAVAGWSLGSVERTLDVEMENVLGEDLDSLDDDMPATASLTLYGKRDAKRGRKMGHWVRLNGSI